jgi:hypothetical protein
MLMPPLVARQCEALPPIGYSEHGQHRLPFAFAPQFFAHHTLIGGKIGDGKHAFMQHLAHAAMLRGGLILIDYYGDLCKKILPIVAPARAEDVICIDFAETITSVGFNPLDVTLSRGSDKSISDLQKMLAHIWFGDWGPKTENAFEMCLRTLFEANKILVARNGDTASQQQFTLLDIVPLLTDVKFCHAILRHIHDDYIQRWWHDYYGTLPRSQQQDVITPVINKVAKFESLVVRRIIGQGASTFNLAQIIAEGKIVVFNLAQNVVGSDMAVFLGTMILGLTQVALECLEYQVAKPLSIMLDEFHMLAGVDYRALAELHRYGVTLFLATQSLKYLRKLDPLVTPIVLATVKQVIAFPTSAQDAELLCSELEVEQNDILHLDIQSCYLSLHTADQRQPTFSLKIIPPLPGNQMLMESIRARSRVRYARPVEEVDQTLHDAIIRNTHYNQHAHKNNDYRYRA